MIYEFLLVHQNIEQYDRLSATILIHILNALQATYKS